MLTFHIASDLESFQQSLDSIGNKASVERNYRLDVLLPAIKAGNWAKLEDMVIYQDEKITIRFGQDKWAFKDSNIKAKSPVNLHFYVDEEQPENVILINNNQRKIINQIKCATLLRMYYIPDKITLSSMRGKVNQLRLVAKEMLKRNISGFEDITEDLLQDWIKGGIDFTSRNTFIGLNTLIVISELLPFGVAFNRLTHKKLNVKKKDSLQHTVIPPRVYFYFLNHFSKAVNYAYKHRDEIEQAVEKMLVQHRALLERRITKLRHGKVRVSKNELKRPSVTQFLKALESEGLDLIDSESQARWKQLYEMHQPAFCLANDVLNTKTFIIAGKSYAYNELRRYLYDLSNMASWLCLVLSGMRIDELFNMHPDFGAQKEELSQGGVESALETVYLLTTRQSKITGDSQKKDDVFVTTHTGFKAFFVLNSVYSPLRKLLHSKKNAMFTNLNELNFPKVVDKAGVGIGVSRFINDYKGIDLTLSRQDLDYLNVSETSHSYGIGDTYNITPHQCRRSLAYYLIGYELCSFPALKQQLGHFSMAMTRWYARNATSYSKFWGEVVDERVKQQAEIYVRIFKRMANGERVAGGKGNTQLKAIAKIGEDYFEDGINKRFLTTKYWEAMLRNKDEHLHAIAPGMYCTNDNCSMRIAIDLTECVDCEYDYIENVVYAESSRVDGMRNLGMLIEMNDLNASSATRCYMQIKAAERIMTDLEFDYEPYQFPDFVEAMVIKIKDID